MEGTKKMGILPIPIPIPSIPSLRAHATHWNGVFEQAWFRTTTDEVSEKCHVQALQEKKENENRHEKVMVPKLSYASPA